MSHNCTNFINSSLQAFTQYFLLALPFLLKLLRQPRLRSIGLSHWLFVCFKLFFILLFLPLFILFVCFSTFLQFFFQLIRTIVKKIKSSSEIDNSADFSCLRLVELCVWLIDFLPKESDHLDDQVCWQRTKLTFTLIYVVMVVNLWFFLNFRPKSELYSLKKGSHFCFFLVSTQTATNFCGCLQGNDRRLFRDFSVFQCVF